MDIFRVSARLAGFELPLFGDKRLFIWQRPFSASLVTLFSPEHTTRNFSAGFVGYAQSNSPAPFLCQKGP